MKNSPLNQKQTVIESIIKLNKAILRDFIGLKQQFESMQINNNEISNTLKTWKSTFQQSVDENLKELKLFSRLYNSADKFNFSNLVKQLTRTYGTDQQYIEAIKCLNSTIEMIKEYIRIKAFKDPTTAIIQKQVFSAQTVLVGSVRSIDI